MEWKNNCNTNHKCFLAPIYKKTSESGIINIIYTINALDKDVKEFVRPLIDSAFLAV